MLKNTPMHLSYHLQAASSSLNLLYIKPLASFMTILIIAIALTLPALFWIVSDNLKNLTANWQREGKISLYLKMPLTSAEENSLLAQIKALDGVGHVTFKTAAESLAELQKQEGMHDIMRYLPENPLPSVIDVIPALGQQSTSQLEQLFTRLKGLPQVEQAKMDMQWINRLHAILHLVTKIAQSLMALLALAVLLIIGNTLRLAIHNRYEEIQVLKLIGATDSFIARPFLYFGIWYGLAGAILAVFFVNLLMLGLASASHQLALAYQTHFSINGLSVKQAYFLVLISMFLGWFGAKLSVNRQLATIGPYT